MNVGLLIASCLTASLSPGPAALSTIETSLRYGQRRAFWHTLGLAVGETPHLFLSLFGTLWLTQHVPYAMPAVAVLGMDIFLLKLTRFQIGLNFKVFSIIFFLSTFN